MWQKAIDEELAALHNNQIISRTYNVTDWVASLRLEQESEKETRKALFTHQKEIDVEIQTFKDSDLSSIQLAGQCKAQCPLSTQSMTSQPAPGPISVVFKVQLGLVFCPGIA